MDGKNRVTLYDAEYNKIGETFARRGAQLVRQQRAEWTDDSHSAIRFHPGMEHADTCEDAGEEIPAVPATHDTPTPREAALPDGIFLEEVDRQMRARRRFVIHTFLLLPGVTFVFISAMIVYDLYFFNVSQNQAAGMTTIITRDIPMMLAAFICTAWLVIYVIHLFLYFTHKRARNKIAKRLRTELAVKD
ncbi:MAG: hypothetical protein FWC16_11560 [Defluviitaleaceae bacterium]|nr:hypothetical protein [Defluviitaleaceae bacterium]MCL2275555.1 hypothetical protein [Defluviitaleaceae bacterium]